MCHTYMISVLYGEAFVSSNWTLEGSIHRKCHCYKVYLLYEQIYAFPRVILEKMSYHNCHIYMTSFLYELSYESLMNTLEALSASARLGPSKSDADVKCRPQLSLVSGSTFILISSFPFNCKTGIKDSLHGASVDGSSCVFAIIKYKFYTIHANFGIKYLVLCKVYTDVGGIK